MPLTDRRTLASTSQGFTRAHAIAALAGLLALFLVGSMVTLPVPPRAPASGPNSEGDGGLFRAVVERVRQGEGYYDAMDIELRARNYPTASPFNWRTPIPFYVMALFPEWGALAVVLGLGTVMLIGFMVHLARALPPEGTIVGLVAAAAAVVTAAAPACRNLTETWCGLIIGLSVLAYLNKAWRTGAVLAIIALLVRELAVPYCVAAMLIAWRHRRRDELMIWVAGLALFGLHYAGHIWQVWAHSRPEDLAHPNSWVQFGALPFWLLLLKANGALLVAPQIVVAAAGALLLASLWARSVPPHVAGAVVSYTIFFCIVGQVFNDYWGFLSAPAWAMGFAYGTMGLPTLVKSAFGATPFRAAQRVEV